MLTRIRIEVEESTAEECVQALDKYENAIHLQEARRYRHLWPVTLEVSERKLLPGLDSEEADSTTFPVNVARTAEDEYPTPDQPWDATRDERYWYHDHFSREITEEVIEYDEGLPGYRGRRVVRFKRLDMREVPDATISANHWNITSNFGGFSSGTSAA